MFVRTNDAYSVKSKTVRKITILLSLVGVGIGENKNIWLKIISIVN